MSDGLPKSDHNLTVFAFLGSATFTALFFLLQSKNIIQNYDFLILIVSIASILFILAIVGRLHISNGNINSNTTYGIIVGLFAVIGLFLILLAIISLVMENNFVIGFIVGVCAITSYLILDIIARKSHKSKSDSQ
jgi:hypothetical protein